MYAYANDNDGKYPTGKSSTEVFQKLIDGGYITDPSLLYVKGLQVPGKTAATSNKLKPENVCWDVTIPADMNNADPSLPLLFCTGYRVEYVPHGGALPLAPGGIPGIVVYYCNNSAQFLPNDGKSDGFVPNLIPATFDTKGVKYIQLTPDGPLQ